MNNKDHYKTAICVYWTPLSYMKDREQTNPDLYAHRQQEQGSAWLYCISYIIYFVQYLSLRFITCILDICRPWERIVRNNGQLRKKFLRAEWKLLCKFWYHLSILPCINSTYNILMSKVLIRKVLPEVLRYTEIVYPSNVQYL